MILQNARPLRISEAFRDTHTRASGSAVSSIAKARSEISSQHGVAQLCACRRLPAACCNGHQSWVSRFFLCCFFGFFSFVSQVFPGAGNSFKLCALHFDSEFVRFRALDNSVTCFFIGNMMIVMDIVEIEIWYMLSLNTASVPHPPFTCAIVTLQASPSPSTYLYMVIRVPVDDDGFPIVDFKLQLRLLRLSYRSPHSVAQSFGDAKGRSSHFMHGTRGVKKILPIVKCDVPDFSSAEPEPDQLNLDDADEPESSLAIFDDAFPSVDDPLPSSSSTAHFDGADGKSGFVSFYNRSLGKESKLNTIYPQKNPNNLQWFLGPTVLVTSFILPSVYLRRILSPIFEDSLLTDFLILFFTEALFYCGVAIFLLLIDRMRRSMTFDSTNDYHRNSPQFGQRISSVATLVLSLIIPMVTMGFVWPWTGPAASAALAPYLVGIVVQFAFEQYAKYKKSPSLPVIPIIFQVYRLHQLNRAAQLVTALSFTIRGAEVTSHSLAINNSLGTLLNVLQFLGVICIWSLSSFIMRYFPSLPLPPSPMQSD